MQTREIKQTLPPVNCYCDSQRLLDYFRVHNLNKKSADPRKQTIPAIVIVNNALT